MIERDSKWLVSAFVLALAPVLPACSGGAAMSGVAVGRVGRGLAVSAQSVPQGAEVCALQDALANQTGPDKGMGDTCGNAIKADQLWRRALIVLAAHGSRLEALASGSKPEAAGQLDGVMTGVRGAEWMQVDDAQQKAARDAVTQLVNQMTAGDSKSDLGKAAQDAAPAVKTLCDGLTSYLDAQIHGAADVETELEKRRMAHANHRCGKVGDSGVCVGETFLDKVVYAEVYGRAEAIESSHMQAHDTLAAFCAAHQKLADAGSNASKDQTYTDIVTAVKAVPVSQPPAGQ
jgi:hypothetical protein